PAGPESVNRTVASHERMRREFAHLFETLGRERPVVIFLDDMHWADASTCDLVGYLASRMRSIPILIVVACRDSELYTRTRPFLALRLGLQLRYEGHHFPLGFLALEDISDYLRARFPLHSFPSEFAAVVHSRTEGNPLFMNDLMRFLVDLSFVVKEGAVWL